MNIDIFPLLLKMISDPSVPGHRVVRKAIYLSMLLSVAVVYFRHVYKDLSLGGPLIFTVGLVLLVLVVVGLFGGVLAASFYEAFLRAVEARRREQTIQTFFAEWLFALLAPVLGLLVMGILGGAGENF